MWTVNDQEFANVLKQSPETRYDYFVKRAADWAVVWGLRAADGWVVAADDQGVEHFPVWPHPRYAQASATGAWQGSKPEPISLNQFLDKWLPGMSRDSKLVAVFPLADARSAVPIDPLRLRADLLAERERLE